MDERFESLARRFGAGAWSAKDNVLAVEVRPPGALDIDRLPLAGSSEFGHLALRGQAALRHGELGLVVLAGGMATRFNWDQPKGVFPIFEDKSFLGCKIEWAREVCGNHLPLYIMTSAHTHDAVARHLVEHDYFGHPVDRVYLFQQSWFPRLVPTGERFVSPDGLEDGASCGHGDFVAALRNSGLLAEFLSGGGTTLLFSNVDNLGATPDLAIVGSHLESGAQMTAEVAPKSPGDRGGAPAMVAGRLQLVEGFAFPADFDQDAIPVFNTATYCFDARSLDREFDLPWYVVEKTVCNQRVIQFECLAGDLSSQLAFRALEVEREDRFIPVKSQADVPHAQILLARKARSLQSALKTPS